MWPRACVVARVPLHTLLLHTPLSKNVRSGVNDNCLMIPTPITIWPCACVRCYRSIWDVNRGRHLNKFKNGNRRDAPISDICMINEDASSSVMMMCASGEHHSTYGCPWRIIEFLMVFTGLVVCARTRVIVCGIVSCFLAFLRACRILLV